MNKNVLVDFSIFHPKLILGIVALVTLVFLAQMPKIHADTNPKNMLPPTSDVRVWNDGVDRIFALYEDTIVVGIVHPESVLNQSTLEKVRDITAEILGIKGVAWRDVSGFTTVDNVTAEGGGLKVGPLVAKIPQSDAGIEALRKMLFENPLLVDRLISRDEKTTAIYVPLQKGVNGKEAADRIRGILAKYPGAEQYHIAGDPVARDTFGAEMFKLMGLFSPISGMIMFFAIYAMFRNLALAVSMMVVAMVAIVWTMGLGIGLGFPIHIMSSMAPVFLMAIATDSIHIFNEFIRTYA